MNIPFTADQFLDVVRLYNETFFPLQFLFNVLALICCYVVFRKRTLSRAIVLGLLAFFWLWMGIAYHLVFFTTINNAAYLFGAAFIVQGILFACHSVSSQGISFRYQKNLAGRVGVIFLVFALAIYPVLGSLSGHAYPYLPTFGLPCPTTIFTFGLLLLADKRIPLYLVIIPVLWSIIGFGAALNFTIYEDTGLLVAGLLGLAIIIRNNRVTGRAPAN